MTSSVIVGMIFFLPLALLGFSRAEQKTLTVQTLERLLQRNYPEAKQELLKVIQQHPDQLLGYFGMMTYSQIRNLENYDFRFEGDYELWAERGRKIALKIYRQPNASGWDLLFAGGALGVSGFQKAHHHQWFPALRDGQAATLAMKRAYEQDPTLADALLGIGLYDYWRSYLTRSVRFLPFFPDRREEGRRKIRRAMEQGELVGPVAQISLAFLDFQAKRYLDVLRMTQEFLKQYPQNIIIRMLEGQTYLEMKRYPEAVADFEKILSIDPQITKCYLLLGQAYAREGRDKKKAKEYLHYFLQVEPNATTPWKKAAQRELQNLGVGKLL